MRYRRLLLLIDVGQPPDAALATVRRLAPAADLLLIVARLPERQIPWLAPEAPADLRQTASAAVAALRESAAGAARQVEVEVVAAVGPDDLEELTRAATVDLLVLGPPAAAWSSTVAEVRRRCAVAVLWVAGAPGAGPLREVLCAALSARARDAITAWLREHGTAELRVTLLLPESLSPLDVGAALEVEGVGAAVELVSPSAALSDRWVNGAAHRARDLVVLARWPGPLMAVAAPSASVLVLPPPPSPRPALERAIDLPDLVVDGGVLRARLRFATGVGRREPIPDQGVVVLARGKVVLGTTSRDGALEFAADLVGDAVGVRRAGAGVDRESPPPGDVYAEVIRPGPRPLVLVDAAVGGDDLAALAGPPPVAGLDLLAVRLRPLQSCRAIRARWRAAGLPARVVDAEAVLDEGDAVDVPAAVDGVRLARVAARLRASGYGVVAIVYAGPHAPHALGVTALRAGELAGTRWPVPTAVAAGGTLGARLAATVDAPLLQGNQVELELDNARARGWLLAAIAGSRERVHLQVYMAADDDVGRAVEGALAAAARRGVTVRVLADSLHGLHGSLGAHNPLLDRLAAVPGVEVRVSRPLAGLLSLEDLKQRDHRKVAVVDGTIALLGGRNLAHEYYTGFAEVALTSRSPWRDVPWLDGGARVEGPAVAALDGGFRQAWCAAGGAAFELLPAPAAGGTPVRVVTHLGLRDAATLEAFLALIDTARSHLYVVNGFPLLLEIQHALLRALARGVGVRTLFGHLTPTHGDTPFAGPWATARTAATELVHSRMDALVAAGADAYRLAVPQQAGWEPGLGPIRPHVHAKAMSADGLACAVGSANLDVTAGYWESEVLLLVEDPALARGLEARVDALIRGSERVDRDDPAWQALAHQRRWMRRWPGVLSV